MKKWIRHVWLVGLVAAAGATGRAAPGAGDGVLTGFDQLWRLSEAEQRAAQRVRFDYLVYFYDPLWQATWGRCGEEEGYLSLGSQLFPIEPGHLIRVEGVMTLAKGMRVDDPRVTVLQEGVPLPVEPTAGDVGNVARFNKRRVRVEGDVDRIVPRDANHVELHLLTEGRPVVLQLVLPKGSASLPQVQDTSVRAKGVYFARNEPGWTEPKIEIWVQGPEDLEIVARIDRDARFAVAPTPIAELGQAPAGTLVRVSGAVQAQEIGRSVRLGGSSGSVVVETAQTRRLEVGAMIEAIGYPEATGAGWVLRRGLFRGVQGLVKTVNEIYQLPEAAKSTWHRVRMEYLVYYADPVWNAMWGRSGDSNDYLSLDPMVASITAGQRLLIEGSVLPSQGMVVREAKVTVLEEGVPLPPVPTDGAVSETRRFDKRLVSVTGFVDLQELTDPRHLRLNLVVDERVVVGRLLVPEGVAEPQWEGALVRVRGVYSFTNDPTSGQPVIECWIQQPGQVEVLGWLAKDERFAEPVTLVENLATRPPGALVRVSGVVRAQEPGRSLTIRDETGQVTLYTAQAQAVSIGDHVEAIGRPEFEGAVWGLRASLFRRAAAAQPGAAIGLPRLRLAEQLRELQPEEAGRSYPVQIKGVVTWVNARTDFFYVNDASGGVCVFKPAQYTGRLVVGSKVEVIGVSAPGRFSPVVMATELETSANVDLPVARAVTLEQAMTGVEEAQWVSLSGYVREVRSEGPWTRLDLTTSAGEFTARVGAESALEKLRGSVVRVRGVCAAVTNDQRQLTGVQLWLPSAQYVEIEEAVPADPFAVPARSMASLRQFSSLPTLNRRVRVAGTVVHHAAGRVVYLEDGAATLRVLSRDALPLTAGDRIEAVGILGRDDNLVVLREAIYRRVGPPVGSVPLVLVGANPLDAELTGRLVRLPARILDVAGPEDRGTRLHVQSGATVFEAVLDQAITAVPAGWARDSEVDLTGVYLVQLDEYRQPHALQLLLRTPADVRVRRGAPWWTVRRVLAVTGLVALGALGGLVWVVALRRRVSQQTAVIREQFEKEKAARLEAVLMRTSKLESLGLLAGGIAHDFNNLLTVVIGNLSLANCDDRMTAETRECLTESARAASRAKDLTQQLLTFAKGGEPVRRSVALTELVREATAFALHGSKLGADFDVAPDLWPADADRGQISQVVQNIVVNAHQAMPGGGTIHLTLRNRLLAAGEIGALKAGRYLELTIADNGPGIPPEQLPRIFEPYYTTKSRGNGLGLATVHSIVKRHGGHLEVESALGVGTTFRIWVVAADHAPSAEKIAEEPIGLKGGRVLFMDDEAPIRLLATAALKRAGLDVTAVKDGAAVVVEYLKARAAGRAYDCVVVDLTVPGAMGGAEAIARLLEQDPAVCAIVSSGYSSDPVMANYRAHGFRGVVPKPYEAADLVKVVASVLGDKAAS